MNPVIGRGQKLRGPFPRLVRDGFSREQPDQEIWDALKLHNELILNAAGEGIYGLDLSGLTTFANPAAAAMTGHTVSELIGKSMHNVVHHSHSDGGKYERPDCPIYAAFRDGLIRKVCDEVFWRKDGSSFPVDYTSTPIVNEGKVVGAVVVFRDISIRKKTEERLRAALDELRELKERLQLENHQLRRSIESTKFPEIVGDSAELQTALELLERAASTDSTVLVYGETGTGKELFARALHDASARHLGPMVRLNCGAISSQLVDSELFGHEKGAFTGADRRRAGRFEQAHGGTLFLDEVGELPLDTQVKLLRALQEREFERVGGDATIQVDVRVVAATNRNLEELVREGRFRMDLFYRLNVVQLSVPPLRSRLSDVSLLVNVFLEQLERRWGRSLPRPRHQQMEELTSYHWPGNVRELHNVLERAAVEADGNRLGSMSRYFQARPQSEASDDPTQPLKSLSGMERAHIIEALRRCHYRIGGPRGAATLLGLHPNTLRYRIQKLGIDRESL